MRVREPIVAGRFYPEKADACRKAVRECLADDREPQGATGSLSAREVSDNTGGQAASGTRPPRELKPRGSGALVGGIVPHAGWMCSGRVAGKVFRLLAKSQQPDVIVLFGGVHRYRGREAAMFGSGRWETPMGSVAVEGRLCERILGLTNLIVDDPFAHENEHSIEVQVPFVIELFPKARIVPIMVPSVDTAPEVGEAVARTIDAYKYDCLIVGTTDLTHYGPSYGFTDHGIGEAGHRWAKENDRPFIDLICRLNAHEVVEEAAARQNACNAGAVAATIAAVRRLKAASATLIEHTTSAEVLGGGHQDSVGYAGFIFAR